MSKSNRLKSYLIFTIFCISLICILLILKEIEKYKNIAYIKSKIENSWTLKTVKLSKVMAVDLPLKLEVNEKKNVYFSAKFIFKGGERSKFQNIFQTSSYNNGIRIKKKTEIQLQLFTQISKIAMDILNKSLKIS